MAFWALFNSDNEILGTGFNASSALAIAKLRSTSEEEIPDIDDIPKAGLMHTITELNTGLEGTPYRLEKITEDQYFELFQPVSRFMVEQADVDDCFFLSTMLVEGMENLQLRGLLLTCFSSDSAGNITVRFPGMPNTSVTFANGQLKTTSNIVSGSKGLQMLEQAYAMIKFQEVQNSNISVNDIAALYSQDFANAVAAVRDGASLTITQAMTLYKGGWYTGSGSVDHDGNSNTPAVSVKGVLDEILPTLSNTGNNLGYNIAASNISSLASKINSDEYIVTVKTKNNITRDDNYQLIASHQYAIERIDTKANKIYIKNPWDSYSVIEMSIDDFKLCFSAIDWRMV